MREIREIIESSSIKREKELPPLFFLGSLLVMFGVGLYFLGILFSVFRLFLGLAEPFRSWNMAILWYSGIPSTLGIVLAALDIALLLPAKRRKSHGRVLNPVADRRVVVALTAYNDEESIGQAVADFRRHPLVRRVIVEIGRAHV